MVGQHCVYRTCLHFLEELFKRKEALIYYSKRNINAITQKNVHKGSFFAQALLTCPGVIFPASHCCQAAGIARHSVVEDMAYFSWSSTLWRRRQGHDVFQLVKYVMAKKTSLLAVH